MFKVAVMQYEIEALVPSPQEKVGGAFVGRVVWNISDVTTV